MSDTYNTNSAGNLGRSGDDTRPSADAGQAPRSSSFVFTSTKVTNLLNSNPSLKCVLTPVQVQTHAVGASHALPEHSSFRQPKEEHRPSPIRQVPILDQSRSKPTGKRFAPRKRLTRASISLYLEAIGQYSSASTPQLSPRARDLLTPAQSDTSPLLTPMSEPPPRHPAQTPPCIREQVSSAKSPAAPSNCREQTDSYFTYRSRRTPSPR
jgi:hypothetical protein